MAGKVRRAIVLAVAGFLHYSGLLRLRRFVRRAIFRKNEVCVLALHRVLSEDEEAHANSLAGIVLKETTFASILEFLKREFDVLPLQEFLLGTEAGFGGSKPLCFVSFDDGWKDNYSTAFPLLKKFGIPATVFLVTGMLSTPEVFWVEEMVRAWKNGEMRQQISARVRQFAQAKEMPDSLEEIVEFCKRMPAEERRRLLSDLWPGSEPPRGQYAADQMMTWAQVQEMSRDNIQFGSHTVTHPLLTYEESAVVQRELKTSKQTLEEKLGHETLAFAYPNGDWNDQVRKIVQETGYRVAFTTRRGWYVVGQDPFTIPRIMLHEGNVTGPTGKFSPAIFSLRLSALY